MPPVVCRAVSTPSSTSEPPTSPPSTPPPSTSPPSTPGDSASEAPASSGARTTVGLIADPGLPTELAHRLAGALPALLSRHAGGEWEVRVDDAEIALDENGALPMIEIGRRVRDREGFDAVVLLSDLPRRAGAQPVVADAGTAYRVGMVSLPALGALAQQRRTRDTVLRLVTGHLLPGEGSTEAQGRSGAAGALSRIDPERGEESETGSAGAEDDVDVRLAVTGARGRLRLLTGMVRANRPWRLVPSLSPAIAAAAAGAAFGVFYSSIWSLAIALGIVRLVVVTLMAMVAMVAWLILDHQLWERRNDRSLREEAILSNATTVLSVATGVLAMFALLFVMTLVAAVVVIPPSYLGSTLMREAGVADYVIIAWLSCAMGTVAGALGSGFADDGAVRQAAYSRRERERRDRLDRQDDEEQA